MDELNIINENGIIQKDSIPINLGYEGRGFQKIILQIKAKEEQIFSRFIALMRRFDSKFQDVRLGGDQISSVWTFDLGRKGTEVIDEFDANVISDGFMKAAVISLMVSLKNSISMMMLEEIENGINPGNIQELMYWIWQASAPDERGVSPQFIITSHSPSVLREFNEHLDHVYTFHLQKKGFRSDVLNLNESMKTFIKMGTVEGEIDEDTGRVEIPKYQLPELWYSGAIG